MRSSVFGDGVSMICGKMQGLVIKKTLARDPRKIADLRRQMREHVQGCDFCMKQYKNGVKWKHKHKK